jgi:hypothetical protein
MQDSKVMLLSPFALFLAKFHEAGSVLHSEIAVVWDGGMAQVVECLPNRHKTLSSNPSTTNNNKKVLFPLLSQFFRIF